MKNNSNPKSFLDVQELSALENETLRGGAEDVKIEKKKEKKRR